MRRSAEREAEGFTLVELLVVVVVLGILAAVATLAIGTNKGTKTACKADFQKVVAAQDQFYSRSNRYATSIGELISPPASPLPSPRGFIKVAPGTADYVILTDSTGSVKVATPSATPVATATSTAGCPA